jgi:hypothetical protein
MSWVCLPNGALLILVVLQAACSDTIHIGGDTVSQAAFGIIEIQMVQDGLPVVPLHFVLLLALLLCLGGDQHVTGGGGAMPSCSSLCLNVL